MPLQAVSYESIFLINCEKNIIWKIKLFLQIDYTNRFYKYIFHELVFVGYFMNLFDKSILQICFMNLVYKLILQINFTNRFYELIVQIDFPLARICILQINKKNILLKII